MRLFFLILTLSGPACPAAAGSCGSIIPSVCAMTVDGATQGRKVIKVAPSVTPFRIGDRFPVETRSILLDPRRYRLPASDGSWRYYALEGVVYRVENRSALVLEVIRNRWVAHLR